MKKSIQPMTRKVYGQTGNAQDIQMNAVRKINNLLSSGTVSVTGPSQQRIIKQQQQPQQKTVFVQKGECYVCDEHIGSTGTLVTEAVTNVSSTKIPTKIGRIVGDAFMVIVSVDDVICKRCLNMFNHMDRLENDLDRVKTNIMSLINTKYGINDGAADIKPPPAKMQRLNTSGTINTAYTNRKTSNGGADVDVPLLQPIQTQTTGGQTRILISGTNDAIDSQLSGMFEGHQNSFGQTQVVRQQVNSPQIVQVPQHQQQPIQQKKPVKIYKCMSCDFKTTDLKQFQPHYETCRQQNGFKCKLCKKLFTNMNALKAHNAEKHTSEFTCSICSINFLNELSFKKHMETNHPDVKAIDTSGQLFECKSLNCHFKTFDATAFEEHSRKHIKQKPFKCRICSARFETRELAGVHAKTHCPDYFKCGTCSMSFPQRELLIKHFETHKPKQQIVQQQQQPQQQTVQQVQVNQQNQQSQELTTQKLLQETIDEALRDSGDASGPKINFYSCHVCSLTFIQENYYKQHMETHNNSKKVSTVAASTATTTLTSTSASHSLIRGDQTRVTTTSASIDQGNQSNQQIADNDLEIMFEKMHSDKAEIEGNANNTNEGLVITSQESSTGGYTFNITMPQQSNADGNGESGANTDAKIKQESGESRQAGSSIDMPALDQSEEQNQQDQQHQVKREPSNQEQQDDEQNAQGGAAVSMPSLDDENEANQTANSDQVPMDLEEIQNAAESGQIKFILNDSGQLIQLDNHILTTDADGNQILVQGADSEHLQQLLQSVGVLQAGDGDGEQTFQMIQGENNQMILVQGDNNEAQLIDASMLNEDGHLVIQQHGDGEMPETMHVVNEDGVQVPVSIAFAQHLEGSAEQQHEEQQETEHEQDDASQEQQSQPEDGESESGKSGEQATTEQSEDATQESTNGKTDETIQTGQTAQPAKSVSDSGEVTIVTTSTTAPVTSTTGEVYFNLEELMNHPEQKQ